MIRLLGPYLTLLCTYSHINNNPSQNYYSLLFQLYYKFKTFIQLYPEYINSTICIISSLQIIISNISNFILSVPINYSEINNKFITLLHGGLRKNELYDTFLTEIIPKYMSLYKNFLNDYCNYSQSYKITANVENDSLNETSFLIYCFLMYYSNNNDNNMNKEDGIIIISTIGDFRVFYLSNPPDERNVFYIIFRNM